MQAFCSLHCGDLIHVKMSFSPRKIPILKFFLLWKAYKLWGHFSNALLYSSQAVHSTNLLGSCN